MCVRREFCGAREAQTRAWDATADARLQDCTLTSKKSSTYTPPHGGPPPHIHLSEDETLSVLDGTPTFRLGDDRIVADPGDFINVPKGVIHCSATSQPNRYG